MTPHDAAPADDDRLVVCAFDGSQDARNAILVAARLMPGARCVVLTAWEPFIDTVTRAGGGFGIVGEVGDVEEIDHRTEEDAQRTAAEGVGVARDAGLQADPRTMTRTGNAAYALLEEAKALDAALIVMGSRGLSRVKSLVLGSVSHGVLNHADRPVLIVPHESRMNPAHPGA